MHVKLVQTRVAILKKEDDCKSLCIPFDFEQEAIRLNQFSQNAGYTKDQIDDVSASLFALNLKRPHGEDSPGDMPPPKRSNSPIQQPPQATTTKLPSGGLLHGRDGVGYTIGNPNRGRDSRRTMGDSQRRSFSQSPIRNQGPQSGVQQRDPNQQRRVFTPVRSRSQPPAYQRNPQYPNQTNTAYSNQSGQDYQTGQRQNQSNQRPFSQGREYQRTFSPSREYGLSSQQRTPSPTRPYYDNQEQDRYGYQNRPYYQGQRDRYARDGYQNRNFDRRDRQYSRGSSRGRQFRNRGYDNRQRNDNYRDYRPYRYNDQQLSRSRNVSGDKIVDTRTSITNNPETIQNTFTISQTCNRRDCYNTPVHAFDKCPRANKQGHNQNF